MFLKPSNRILKFLKKKNLLDYGNYFFLIGVLFLPSALPISGSFLLLSLIIALKENLRKILLDKSNYLIFMIAALMLFSSFFNFFNSDKSLQIYLKSGNSFLDLFNWIPLFFSYIGFQVYLKSHNQRLIFTKFLVISTLPVLFSCISQYWFQSFGPFTTLNGLITWYQKPFENDQSGITGLFSNPNYTGFWFASIFPFTLSLFILKKKSKLFFLFLINSLLTFYFLLYTSSRNAFLSLSISSLILFGSKSIFIYVLIFILILLFTFVINHLLLINFPKMIEFIIPINLFNKFSTFSPTSILGSHRFDIYKEVILLILKRPLMGWGAGTFAVLYSLKSNYSPATHSHNIIFEISYHYGIITSTLFVLFLFLLLYKSYKFLKRRQNNDSYLADKFWLTATLSSVLFHMSDMPYYDGKISLLFWILLSGLKCIENNLYEEELSNKISLY